MCVVYGAGIDVMKIGNQFLRLLSFSRRLFHALRGIQFGEPFFDNTSSHSYEYDAPMSSSEVSTRVKEACLSNLPF